jgi:agmatine deiminase
MTKATPTQLGYRMPAEWERQAAVWMTWPHNPELWPADRNDILRTFAKLAAEITTSEPLEMLVLNQDKELEARQFIAEAGGDLTAARFHKVATDDSWMRDSGPTFVTRPQGGKTETALVGWRYNAWGGKFPPWDKDDQIPAEISERLGLPLFEPGIVLEGGSIDVNGRGTVLTTEQCLLNPNRNPKLSRGQIEGYLKDYLGVSNVLWLGEGLEGDDTDGHIDDITRFVSADTILTVFEEDPSDVNHRALADNLERLERAVDQDGKPFKIITLLMPEPVEFEGQRLPASYGNFLITNTKIIVPIFGGARDQVAMDQLQQIFPSRKVVGIRFNEVIRNGGACHCVTQQQPA